MKRWVAAFILIATSLSARASQPKLVLRCHSAMFDVAVIQEMRGRLSKITISISDLSGHGKDYSVVTALPFKTALHAGIEGVSFQDMLGQPTHAETGRETFKLNGKHASLTGELPTRVRCK